MERGLARNTLESYERDLTHFVEYIISQGLESLEQVSRLHIVSYLLQLKQLGRASATVSRHMVSIRSFFQFLVREHMLDKDPSLHMETPKLAKRLPRVLSIKEVEALLESPQILTPQGVRDKAMLELLYATGLRYLIF